MVTSSSRVASQHLPMPAPSSSLTHARRLWWIHRRLGTATPNPSPGVLRSLGCSPTTSTHQHDGWVADPESDSVLQHRGHAPPPDVLSDLARIALGNLGGISFRVVGVFLLVPKGLLLETPSFSSGENGELRVGVSRAMRQLSNVPSSVTSSQSMHLGVLVTAWHAINTKSMFTVYYKTIKHVSESWLV